MSADAKMTETEAAAALLNPIPEEAAGGGAAGMGGNATVSKSLTSVSRKTKGWEDITEALKSAAKGMKVGSMIHGDHFSLYEAMSALELMDPKMDPGMKLPSEKERKSMAKVTADLTSQQVLSIMDKCIACFVAWCEGHTLCHTVATCLYLQPENIERNDMPSALRAFSKAMLKLCREVRDVVLRADIYEEEDFMSNTFGFDLGDKMEQAHVLAELEQATAALATGAATPTEKLKELCGTPSSEEAKVNDQVVKGIRGRLMLVRHLWLLHQALSLRKAEDAKALISQVEKTLKVVRGSHKYAEKDPVGFDDTIPRIMVPHIPPRTVSPPNALATMLHFLTLLKHLKRCLRLEGEIRNIEDLITYFHGLSVEKPGIIARSHLLLMLNTENDFLGLGSLTDLVRESFRRFCPTFLLSDLDPDMPLFMSRVTKPLCHVLRLYCENRARQRRKISKLLPDWSILQQDAMLLDRRAVNSMTKIGIPMQQGGAVPSRHPCFCWVFDITVRLLAHHVTLGFELELFQPREFATAFWYLEYLLTCRLQNHMLGQKTIDPKWQRKLDLLVQKKTAEKEKGAGQRGGGAKKRPRKKKGKRASSKSPATAEILMVEAQKDLSRGIYKTLQALQAMGVVAFPPLPFGSDALNFRHRFAVFRKVPQPVALSYEDYKMHSELKAGVSPQQPLMIAAKALDSAKILITAASKRTALLPPELLHCRQLLKVAVANRVFLLMVQKASQKPAPGDAKSKNNPTLKGYEVDFDFSAQANFPVMKLVKMKVSPPAEVAEKKGAVRKVAKEDKAPAAPPQKAQT